MLLFESRTTYLTVNVCWKCSDEHSHYSYLEIHRLSTQRLLPKHMLKMNEKRLNSVHPYS